MKTIKIITQSSVSGLNAKIAKLIKDSIHGVQFEVDLDPSFQSISNAVDGYVFIVPEWNGSFPYMFKKMIDESGYPSSLENVPVFLIGTSSSSLGNMMGIAHLSYVLGFVGSRVHPELRCISNLTEMHSPNLKDVNSMLKSLENFLVSINCLDLQPSNQADEQH